MWTDKDFSLLHKLPAELVDRIYSQALHETTLPNDVMSLITTYNQYTNRLTNLANTYDRIRQITAYIARLAFSAVQMRYDSFVRPSPYTGPVYEITPEQWIRSGALALVSLRELLPYMSKDYRTDLALLVQHNFECGFTRKMTTDDKRAILNAKMLILAGYEDCLALFDDKEGLEICGHLGQYHQEIQGNLRPGEERHKVDDYRRIIKPRSEVRQNQLEEVVSKVQNWLVPRADEAEILSNDAPYNKIDVEGKVLEEISQDLSSDSIPELAYFVTRLAVIIRDCYKRETRSDVEKLGKHDSGSETRSI